MEGREKELERGDHNLHEADIDTKSLPAESCSRAEVQAASQSGTWKNSHQYQENGPALHRPIAATWPAKVARARAELAVHLRQTAMPEARLGHGRDVENAHGLVPPGRRNVVPIARGPRDARLVAVQDAHSFDVLLLLRPWDVWGARKWPEAQTAIIARGDDAATVHGDPAHCGEVPEELPRARSAIRAARLSQVPRLHLEVRPSGDQSVLIHMGNLVDSFVRVRVFDSFG